MERDAVKTFRDNVAARRLTPSESRSPVLAVWTRLSSVNSLSFSVRSPRMNGNGAGHVRIVWVGDTAMEFEESGLWHPFSGKPIHFSNTYRWLKSEDSHSLNLYHRRTDVLDPVFLCTFSPVQHGVRLRATPHFCGQDLYQGDLLVKNNLIELRWKITGPNKDDTLSISYGRSTLHPPTNHH
jgi:hypothetical protein